MIRRFATAGSVLALVLAWASLVSAQSTQPERIAFQGRLTGADGNPVTNGALSMTFSIYDSASAPFGSYLWREAQTVAVTGGLYSVQLGSVTALPGSLFPDHATERWLGVRVGTDAEMAPRYALTGSPYARRAQAATTADMATNATNATHASDADTLSTQSPAYYLNLTNHIGTLSAAQLPTGGSWTLTSPLLMDGGTLSIDPTTDRVTAGGTGGLSVDTIWNLARNARLDFTDDASHTVVSNQHGVIPIPDENSGGASDTLDVTDLGIASKIVVSVRITGHSNIAELRITLAAPGGTPTYVLKDFGTGSGSVLDTSWPVPTPTVSGDLTYWNGRNPAGIWTLNVRDNTYDDPFPFLDGHIESWSITHYRGGLAITGQGNFTTGAGIPPLQVTSEATVTHLSADLLDGLDAAAFALLGGRAGGQTLCGGVAASGNLTLDSTVNATKGNILLAPAGGNVGIGTIAPAYKLNVAGVIGAGDADFTCALIGNPTALGYSNGYAGLWKAGASDYSFLTNGAHTYVNAPDASGNIYFNNMNRDRMTILANGYVGIGTPTPTHKLDIRGLGEAPLPDDTRLRIDSRNTTTNAVALEFTTTIITNDEGYDVEQITDNAYIYYGLTGARGNWLHLEVPPGQGGISFDTDGYNPRMVVKQDGNINIGPPMPDGYPAMFHVSDNRPTNGWGFNIGIHSETNNPDTGGTLDQYAVFGSAGTAGTGNQYGVYGTASGNGQNIGIYGSATGTGTNWAGYFGAGNVYVSGRLGIGTTSPARKLEVEGTTDTFIQIDPGDTASRIGGLILASSNTDRALIWYGLTSTAGKWLHLDTEPGQGGISLSTDGSPRMVILQDGSVGIGTSTPAAGVKLDVQGGLYVDNGNVGFGCQPSPDYRFVAVGNASIDGRVCIGRVYTPVNNHLVVSGNAAIDGNLRVDGQLTVVGPKLFRIDHPLDPANKYLNHFCIESSDAMNVYNGNVTLDDRGEAVITLPAWFEALNRDFRYQLTCIGGFAPVYVAEKVAGNRFTIAGGKPGLDVSWQITGVRQDPAMQRSRLPVEESKPESERGQYLYPEGYGKPVEARIGYAPPVVRAGK